MAAGYDECAEARNERRQHVMALIAQAAALAEVVAGQDGIDPGHATIVAAALAQRDRPARQR